MLDRLLPDFFDYWVTVGFDKLFRIFWYFFVFEFVRYVLLDYIVLLVHWLTRKKRERMYQEARRKLYAEKPLISIICPGKNEGKHIYPLTKSLREQTYQNLELIIVDDGSDDDTRFIGRDLERRGLITKFIRNEIRGGKASAANTALNYCHGKFIVHIDADCSFDRDAIEYIILPFYIDPRIGCVGGNVKVRNREKNLVTRFQAIEYLKTISVGRVVTSFLGIYKIVSGAFGAFRPDVLKMVGGWDIGPGLDGDITVKYRKAGYRIYFENKAVCLTSVPEKVKVLIKQRLRWDKSIIRFRLRKHVDVYRPDANFTWSTFFALFENVFYNLVLDVFWWVYLFDMLFNYTSQLDFIILTNLSLYVIVNYLQFLTALAFSERASEERKLWPMVFFMFLYVGVFLRFVRTAAYYKEIFFKRSYEDNWNPRKSSDMAKKYNL